MLRVWKEAVEDSENEPMWCCNLEDICGRVQLSFPDVETMFDFVRSRLDGDSTGRAEEDLNEESVSAAGSP